MATVRWTSQAIEDINNIAEYISKDSEKYARVQVEIFFERCRILEQFPHTGRMLPEAGHESIRELVTGSYRIVYHIRNKNMIDILTVHHSYRILKIK